MAQIKANCGGLVLDNTSLKIVNKIITTIDGDNPMEYITSNCGGILFDKAIFKKVDNVITSVNLGEEEVVRPKLVQTQGCGGLLVDENYFTLGENGLNFQNIIPIDTAQITFTANVDTYTVEVKDSQEEVVEETTEHVYDLNIGEIYTYVCKSTGYQDITNSLTVNETETIDLTFTPVDEE